MYSPQDSRETIGFFPRLSSWVPVLREEDLELRLGLGAPIRRTGSPSEEEQVAEDGVQDQHTKKYHKLILSSLEILQKAVSLCRRFTCWYQMSDCSYGRKCGQAGPRVTKEVKLRCNICMGIMREETSTVCGHIFCKPCITDAILQRKCPACRVKLSIQNIHRIYLPRSTP